jgi:signal transduction histidine kinase
VARRVADWAQAPLSSAPLVAPVMPGRVAAALAQAAGEALANVARHAGTDEAWVAVRPCSPAPGSAGSAGTVLAGVSVVVRDEGAGFDPDRIGPDRLGVRRSIVERVADWGGRATIESAPGAGTVVSLAWTAGEPAW